MTDQQPDDRIMIEDAQLLVEVNYHNDEDDGQIAILLSPGEEPFILFQMKQKDGAIVLDVTASQIESEDELIETLEVFFETMLEERRLRGLVNLSEIVEEVEADQNDGSNGWGVDNV